MGISNCQTGNRPSWTAEFWAGDAESASVVRDQEEVAVSCAEPDFDNFVCLTYGDLYKLETEVLQKCEKWQGDSAPSFTDR